MLATLLLIGSLLADPIPRKATFQINVTNIRTMSGNLRVAVFNCKDFPDCKPVYTKSLPVVQGQQQATFQVEPGDYAVAIHHDVNSNGKMEKKMFGIPKEPYGFSNNFRPVMSAPKFNDCRVTVGSGGKTIGIKLN